MIVNYDGGPKNSIIFTAGIILKYLYDKRTSNDFESIMNFCTEQKMEYSLFILSIDWLFLVEIIKEVNEKNEVILCI